VESSIGCWAAWRAPFAFDVVVHMVIVVWGVPFDSWAKAERHQEALEADAPFDFWVTAVLHLVASVVVA